MRMLTPGSAALHLGLNSLVSFADYSKNLCEVNDHPYKGGMASLRAGVVLSEFFAFFRVVLWF
jgi:hypothetical protein